MTVQDIKNMTVKSKEPKSFKQILEQYKGEVARALPSHLRVDRMIRIALTEFSKNKELANCDPKTIFASIIIASQLGLEPGIMGQGYLIPYKGKCQFIPGWQGLVDLVSRSKRASITTAAVYEGDIFDYELGTNSYIKHKPLSCEIDTAKLLYVYAIGRINGIEHPVIEVWSREKIIANRNANNKMGSLHYSFKYFEMYARKIVLLQVLKYMPKSIEVASAVSLEYSAQSGMQNLKIEDAKDVIDGTWVCEEPEKEVIESQTKESEKENSHGAH